ncbi:nitroreductase family protein [Lacticaseibacillus porcinae]|uniref:nitroreductase family protein n=1 Tax=Lacticaseibacillus porcinae TaxID=1123687 RepID=UPI0013DDAB4D|nr:nitroreductase family protein [Lacticaseibacillus porcinae]
MKIKEQIKQLVPASLLHHVQMFKASQKFDRASKIDKDRYLKNAAVIFPEDDEETIKAALLFHTHAIEKGLSHPNFRPNFGHTALASLASLSSKYVASGYSVDAFEFQNYLSVLKAYKERHEHLNISTPYFDKLFRHVGYRNATDMAGVSTISRDSSECRKINYLDLMQCRHSVREYSDEKVLKSQIESAASCLPLTPSVCNRQPWKVTTMMDSEKISTILKLQGGFKGYNLPPALSIISTSDASFRGIDERNEPYVEGGLVLMSYLLGLTAENLASCTLNMMLDQERMNEIRKVYQLPESETMIALVAIGHFKESYYIAKSKRRDPADVCNFLE